MPKKKVATKASVKRTSRTIPSRRNYENSVERFFVVTMPPMPDGLKEFLVGFGPWVVLVMLVMMLPAVLAVFGLGTMMAPFGYMKYGLGYGYSLQWMISLVSFGLTALALPGLFKRQLSSWRLVLYSVIVSAVGVLLNGNLVSLIVGTGLSLYVLYQIKSYYK